jgi:hypothetical protein
MTGLIASGYCSAHPDGIITTMMTGHMRIPPNAILKILLIEDPNRELLKQKAWTSAAHITSFFVGSIAGAYSKDLILMTYEQRRFCPVFTYFGCCMATLCCGACIIIAARDSGTFMHGANLAIELGKKAIFPAPLVDSMNRTSVARTLSRTRILLI